jgi:hypothetical protein
MLKNHVASGKEFASQQASISAALVSAAAPHRAAAERVLAAALRSLKVSSPRYTVAATMKNSFEGQVDFNLSCVSQNWPVTFKASAMVKDGKLEFSEKDVAEPLAAALTASKAVKIEAAATKTIEVDLTKVVAFRAGDVVSFSSPELPSWALHLKANELADEQSRKFAPSRVMASIRGFCVTSFNVTASFKQEEFKLPVIQAHVVAKIVAKPLPTWQLPVVAAAQNPQVVIDNLSVHASKPAQERDPNQSLIRANDARRQFENHLRATAEPAAIAWVRANLKGGAPSVKAADMSGVQYDANRNLAGAAVVTVKFYGSMGVEEASVSVPFDKMGRADVKAIQRTQADLMAEEQRAAALKIKSDEEARNQFEQFVKSERAKQERIAGMGVKASVGYGGSKPLPNFIINVPKVSLPESVSVVGKKIVVDGMVYEVEPTNFNSPDIEHCAFWALRLKPELGIKDADYVPNYSGVTAKLQGASI